MTYSVNPWTETDSGWDEAAIRAVPNYKTALDCAVAQVAEGTHHRVEVLLNRPPEALPSYRTGRPKMQALTSILSIGGPSISTVIAWWTPPSRTM